MNFRLRLRRPMSATASRQARIAKLQGHGATDYGIAVAGHCLKECSVASSTSSRSATRIIAEMSQRDRNREIDRGDDGWEKFVEKPGLEGEPEMSARACRKQ